MTVCGRIPPDPVPADPVPSGPVPRAVGAAVPAAAPRVPYEGTWRFTAPALDSSVPQVRHAVRDLLARQRVPVRDETADGLLLIVSELVTNAVRHAAVLSPRITVEIAVTTGWVRIAVADDHPYRPKALEADHVRTGGRGLLLVKAITVEAGGSCDVEHTPEGGKVVWAALPLHAAS
ncbi:ATP-binding protein [Streptomyces sp. PTM05]|uniref:ATP-binding protein n=1 Tax=Streptantibioticus parmotrematis TaxID=2873249 RepID=A0ABS7QWJ9_9ACTN|nr:ATP-binding protein [Streptantibioticus parmotrematis]MBY8887593.1 ATP-binding protein [Streptantibioticus parmotrematis]